MFILAHLTSFLHFTRSRIVLVYSVFVKNSLSSAPASHTRKETQRRVWLQFSIEGSSVFAIVSQQERPDYYIKEFPTGVYIRASMFTTLLCLSGARMSYICLLWLVLLAFYNLCLISRQKLLRALLAGDNCSILSAVSSPALQHTSVANG